MFNANGLDLENGWYRDRFGNVIVPGDWLVYGRTDGQSPTTGIGRLIEVLAGSPDPRNKQPTAKLVIASVQDDQGWFRHQRLPHIRRVRLTDAERVLKYPLDLIGGAVLAAYDLAAFKAA